MKALKIHGLMVMFMLAALGPASGVAPSAQDDVLSLFVKAGYAYKGGKYQEAIQLYEAIVKTGKVTGAMYYNLGNSYFKAGSLGKAVLNYERARRLVPRDGDLDSNLEFARSALKSGPLLPKGSWIERWLNRYGEFLSTDEWAVALVVLLLATALVHLSSLWLNWPKAPAHSMVLILSFLLVGHGILFFEKIARESRQAIAITQTAARFEPREDATIHFDLEEGHQLELLWSEGAWVKVKRADGNIGWARREDVEKI